MNIFSIILALVFTVVDVCQSHGHFRHFIPNGFNVPNPCSSNATDLWPWVGHLNNTHLNNFGEALRNSSQKPHLRIDTVWQDLCNKDSDGDGRTNGEELGDIACKWKTGNPNPNRPNRPSRPDRRWNNRFRLSHPGIPENPDGTVSFANQQIYC